MKKISHVDLNNLSAEDIFFIRQAYQLDFNIYYEQYKEKIMDLDINNRLIKLKEEYIQKISDLKEKNIPNNDKFIIIVDNNLLGYIKYRIENSEIYVGSIYGENDQIIRELLKELNKFKKFHLENTICNLDLHGILIEIARMIKIEDFIEDPDLLTKLNKEQLIEILKSIKMVKNNSHNSNDYIEDSSYNEDNIDNSSLVKGVQKKITNGHSIIVDDDKAKQGFVDALVLSLLSGFVSGIITTLVIIFIKLKTGI